MRSKVAYTIIRIIFGLAWLFYGVTKFLSLPAPELPGPAAAFLTSMAATGYFIPFVGVAETLVGLLLLANFWVPLSMVILAPIMLNVILFNLFLAPSLVGFIMLFVLTALQVYIMYYTWSHYKPLFAKKIR